MSEQRIKIPRTSDKALFSCFKEIGERFGVDTCNINALGFNNLGAVSLSNESQTLALLLKKNSAIIDSASMNIEGFSVAFYRGGNCQPQDKSGIYDEIVLRQGNPITLSNENRIELVTIIISKLKAFDPKRSIGGVTEEQAQLAAIHTSTLERLESLNEKLIEETHNYRKQHDEYFAAKISEADDKYKRLESQLNEQHNEKLEALEISKRELELRKKELDDRSNTHARREIRRDILKEIKSRQEKFSLTQGTRNLRAPIFSAMSLLVMLFVVGAAVTWINIHDWVDPKSSDGNYRYYLLVVKQILYSAGAVTSLVFLIRWLNRWFEQHAQAEFQLKQFELDMERASWLVETSLEWNDAKGTTIPNSLMDSLSRNLFSNAQNEVAPLAHPADQLASAILGSASKVKLQVGDSLLEIDPKKLAKSEKIKTSSSSKRTTEMPPVATAD